jgi:hypothetical protein
MNPDYIKVTVHWQTYCKEKGSDERKQVVQFQKLNQEHLVVRKWEVCLCVRVCARAKRIRRISVDSTNPPLEYTVWREVFINTYKVS